MSRFSYILVLLGAVLWGTTGTAQTFFAENVHPLAVGAVRLFIGGFSLLVIVYFMKKLDFRDWPWKATLLAALAMAIFQPFFFTSVRLTGIAVGTVVAIGSAPVFSGLIEWIYLKRRPTGVWIIATLLAITGCALLFLNKDSVAINPVGVALSLGAGVMFAVYALVSKYVLEKAEAIPAVAVIFSTSAMMLLPFVFLFDTTGLQSVRGISVIVYLGIATTSVAYILFSTGLKRIPSSSAVTLSLAEPLTAAMLGVLVVGEKLTTVSWIGIVLLLGGILVLTFGTNKS